MAYQLAITKPEEGAGAAFDAMKNLLNTLGIFYTTDEVCMELGERVLNPEAVNNAVAYVKKNKKAIYVKGPGITPTDEQIIETIITLENRKALNFTGSASNINDKLPELREENKNPREFALAVKKLRGNAGLGSPNAGWRDDLQVNLARGTSDRLTENSLVTPPKWDRNTPLTVAAFAHTEKNRLTEFVSETTTFFVTFESDDKTPAEKIGEQPVSGGTPIRVSTFAEAEVKAWAKAALLDNKDAQIAHGTKQTVLKTSDKTLINWLQEVINEENLNAKIAPFAQNRENPKELGSLLVDDLFSRLSTAELKTPLLILSPNHSYSSYVKEVWDGIKEKGGFKLAKQSQILRASATRDHYKAIEYKAAKAGKLLIKDENGVQIAKKPLQAGEVAMVTHFDRDRARQLVGNTLETAKNDGRKTVLFGFDESDPYYKIAVNELEAIKGQYPTIEIKIMEAGAATVYYLTKGVENTVLVLNNIYGDFATDIELNGKGTAYSIGTIYDGRGAVELGSGGTAPDLIQLWKETCTLRFNPMSFVEGVSLAILAQSKLMKGQEREAEIAIAKALEDAIYATTSKGIVPPIVEGKFRKNEGETYKKVTSQTFLKSVEVEAMRILDLPHLKKKEAELEAAIALDAALYEADTKYGKEWRELNKKWNEQREKSGEIDIVKPDYSISLPEGFAVSAEALLELQKKRVG